MKSDVDKYRRCFPLYTIRFAPNLTEVISELQYSLRTEARKLVEKQFKNIETTVERDIKDFDAFFPSIDSRLGLPGLSSRYVREKYRSSV